MGKVRKVLASGKVWEADTDVYSAEAIDRAVNEYNARWETEHNTPQVPTGDTAGEQDYAKFAAPDPSETDSWPTWTKKMAGSALYGTGQGLSYLGDLGASAGNVLLDDYKMMTGQEVSPSSSISPVSEAYTANMPSPPVGSDYETAQSYGEEYGPAIATEALTAGAATPGLILRQGLKQGLKTGAKELAKAPIRGAIDTKVGIASGEGGGALGEMLGGERGRTLGSLLGSFATPGAAVYGGKKLLNAAFMNDRSGKLVKLIDFLNEKLPADKQIPITFGTVGNKGAQLAEDLTARGLLSGQPAIQAREKYYGGIEQTGIDQMDRIRGHQRVGDNWVEGAPSPATGEITERTVGAETNYMAQQAHQHAADVIKKYSKELEADIGHANVDPAEFYAAMGAIIGNPRSHDASTVRNAQTLVQRFEENMPPPVTGIGPRQPPTYPQVFERRAIQGQEVDAQGQRIKKGVEKQAYAAQTADMRDTAIQQGVPADEFDRKQAAIKEGYDDQELIDPVKDAPNEVEASHKVWGGSAGKSLEPLLHYIRRVPETLAKVMANATELGIRGPNAGKPVSPQSFPIRGPIDKWGRMDPEWKMTRAADNPDVVKRLNAASELAEADTVRSGKRSVPGSPGSTIGATAQLMALPSIGALLGSHSESIGAILGGFGAVIGAPAANYAIGRMMTNPKFVRSVVDPKIEWATALRRGLAGTAAEGANWGLAQQDAERRRREAEDLKLYQSGP